MNCVWIFSFNIFKTWMTVGKQNCIKGDYCVRNDNILDIEG